MSDSNTAIVDPPCEECGWEKSHVRHHDENLYNFHPHVDSGREGEPSDG